MKTKWILISFVFSALALTVLALIGCKDDDGTYTITFHANNGTGAINPIIVNAGSSVTLPSGDGFSRTGYVFSSWNTIAAGTGTHYAAGSSFTPTGNVTLYAKWERITSYTVTFDLNDGSGAADPQAASTGSSITLQSPPRTGYTFGGWNTSADGTGTNYAAGSSYRVNGNVTLYAQWVFTVTFHINGGSGAAPNPKTVSEGSSITLPSLSRPGYTFDGWNTSADGTGDDYEAGDSFTPTDNITLYAQWEGIYTITFKANGASGRVPDSLQVRAGDSIVLPDNGNLSLVYADFTGWNTSTSSLGGTAYTAGVSYTLTRSIILYAQWNSNTDFASVPNDLAEKLSWLRAHAQSDTEYTITVTADVSIDPQTLPSGRDNTTITLVGSGSSRIIDLSSNGPMFTLDTGVTLVLDNNITLRGRSSNNNSLVRVSGGKLIMKNGSAITGNTAAGFYSNGGGVYVADGGSFTMNGGTISGNSATNGGGVYVDIDNSIFTMNGGTISGNSALSYGGGVYVSDTYKNWAGPGNFIKNGGTIYGYNAGDAVNSNTVDAGIALSEKRGHAAYVNSLPPFLSRETTAGSNVNFAFVNRTITGYWEYGL
jgi:uncharacterized repeat protein (TIGR02543 family)